MQELIVTIVKGLVDDKDAVSVTVDEPKEDGTVVYHLHVAADDMGRVIGKQGRIAKAIRTIVRSAAGKVEQKVAVEIDQDGHCNPNLKMDHPKGRKGNLALGVLFYCLTSEIFVLNFYQYLCDGKGGDRFGKSSEQ